MMKYTLEVPKNARLNQHSVLKHGDRYVAKYAGIQCAEYGRLFRVYLPGVVVSANEFYSLHLSGGHWIVHEEEE